MRKWLIIPFILSACTFGFDPVPVQPGGSPANGESATVTAVLDGDTIDVNLNGQTVRVRYVGVNTPEIDEACYDQATSANAAMVRGQAVTLVKDRSETDRFGRLLRYVYVGDTFVNAQLVAQGYAEAVLYEPDRANYDYFLGLERQARSQNLGCHSSGIFNDGSDTR